MYPSVSFFKPSLVILSVNWAAKYQTKRDQYWPEVEQFFGQLSPRLLRQGILLQNNLATFYADTGQFKDILCRERDHPLLYLHLWLLDDWGHPVTTPRNELERRLFLGMLFTFAAVYTHETILDESTNFDNSYLFLECALTQQANFHLAQIFPGSSLFWTYHRTFWQDYAEAVLTTADPSASSFDKLREPLRTGRRPPTAASPGKVSNPQFPTPNPQPLTPVSWLSPKSRSWL